jgi:uncharacterized protein YjiS (DUF1127 family)
MRFIPRRSERSGIHEQRDIAGSAAWWRIAWRAFGRLRERKDTRVALANMTQRELADIGMTACDRAMALARHEWADPDSNRNDTPFSQRRSGVG